MKKTYLTLNKIQILSWQGHALLYAGVGVRTPDTPLIHFEKGEF